MKKRYSFIILNVILISMLFSVLSISRSYSLTEGICSKFEITQESTGNSGDMGSDTFPDHPKFNNEKLEHQYSKIEISDLRTEKTQSGSTSFGDFSNNPYRALSISEKTNSRTFQPSLDFDITYEQENALIEDTISYGALTGDDSYSVDLQPSYTHILDYDYEVGVDPLEDYPISISFDLSGYIECSMILHTPNVYAGNEFQFDLGDGTQTQNTESANYDLDGSETAFSGEYTSQEGDVSIDIYGYTASDSFTASFSNSIDALGNTKVCIGFSGGSDFSNFQIETPDTTLSPSDLSDITELLDINTKQHEFIFSCDFTDSGGRIRVDYIYEELIIDPFDSVYLDNFKYKIGSGTEQTKDIQLKAHITDHNHYTFDDYVGSFSISITGSDIDDSFDYNIHSLFLYEQNTNFVLERVNQASRFRFRIDSFSIETTESVTPSAIALQCNTKEIVDTSTSGGFCIFDSYPSSLEFTSSDDVVIFDYDHVSYFSHNLSLSEISSSYLYKAISVSADTSLDITRIEHNITEMTFWSISEYSYDSDPDSFATFTDFSVGDGSNLYLEIITSENIHKSLDLSNSYIYSGDISTDDPLVSYIYSYQATDNFNYWYFENPDFTNYISPLNSLDSFQEGASLTMLEDPLMNGDIVNFRVYRNTGFDISYSEIESNDQQTTYAISYSSNFAIENVDLVIELEKYYAEWDVGTQTEEKKLTIEDIDFTTDIQTLEITGSIPDPSPVSFKTFQLENTGTIFDPQGEVVNIYGNLNITEENFAYSLEIREGWAIDKVYDSLGTEISVNEQNNFFNDSNMLNPYLSFRANPIKSYSTNQSETQLEIMIETDLNISINVMYYIENRENNIRNLNESNHYVGNDGEVSWYYQEFRLRTGTNTFVIQIEEQTPSKWGVYIASFLLVAVVGYAISKADFNAIKKRMNKWRTN